MIEHEVTYTVGLRRLMSEYQKITASAGNPDATAAIRTLLEIRRRIDGALSYWWATEAQKHAKTNQGDAIS